MTHPGRDLRILLAGLVWMATIALGAPAASQTSARPDLAAERALIASRTPAALGALLYSGQTSPEFAWLGVDRPHLALGPQLTLWTRPWAIESRADDPRLAGLCKVFIASSSVKLEPFALTPDHFYTRFAYRGVTRAELGGPEGMIAPERLDAFCRGDDPTKAAYAAAGSPTVFGMAPVAAAPASDPASRAADRAAVETRSAAELAALMYQGLPSPPFAWRSFLGDDARYAPSIELRTRPQLVETRPGDSSVAGLCRTFVVLAGIAGRSSLRVQDTAVNYLAYRPLPRSSLSGSSLEAFCASDDPRRGYMQSRQPERVAEGVALLHRVLSNPAAQATAEIRCTVGRELPLCGLTQDLASEWLGVVDLTLCGDEGWAAAECFRYSFMDRYGPDPRFYTLAIENTPANPRISIRRSTKP